MDCSKSVVVFIGLVVFSVILLNLTGHVNFFDKKELNC